MGIWPFKKRTSIKENISFNGFTDWHSHILPGVDDGVKTMEESLEILDIYGRLGAKGIWLTPHIMEDIPNSTSFLKERFAELKAAYGGSVELHLASENMLDALFERRLNENDLLPIGENGDHLLVETSYFNPPINLYGLLEQIKAKGYHPLLAHPERYLYMDKKDYAKLKGMGVKFQLNLPSLAGMYGKSVQKRARFLSDLGSYEYCGTDLHRKERLVSLLQTDERLYKAILKR